MRTKSRKELEEQASAMIGEHIIGGEYWMPSECVCTLPRYQLKSMAKPEHVQPKHTDGRLCCVCNRPISYSSGTRCKSCYVGELIDKRRMAASWLDRDYGWANEQLVPVVNHDYE